MIELAIPYENFTACAMVLDNTTLLRNYTFAWTLTQTIWEDTGWRDEAQFLAWVSWPAALASFGMQMALELRFARGHKAPMLPKFITAWSSYGPQRRGQATPRPPWIGGDIHAAWRQRLLTEQPEWYRDRFPEEMEMEEF